MHHRPFRLTLAAVLAALLAGASLEASALELYGDDERHLNANVEAVFGVFHSEESYAIARDQPGSTSWREGYIKYGLSGDQRLGGSGSLYGAFALLSSGTWAMATPPVSATAANAPPRSRMPTWAGSPATWCPRWARTVSTCRSASR